MYTLYIANKNYSSWSLRPWVLMRTLGLPFEERLVPFGSAPFRAFSPSGTVPCLHDGDVVVWDSLAIVEYLAERHPGVWPADPAVRAWARSAAAEMHGGFRELRTRCSMSVGVRMRGDLLAPGLRRDLDRIDQVWAEGLERSGGPFLTGPAFTAVDAFFAPVAFRMRTWGLPLAHAAYAERLLELPAMRDWAEAAVAEPWRDEGHDQEVLSFGELLADLRTRG